MKAKILNLNELSAINPLDGRYRKKIEELSSFFSEFALIKTRLEVELKYFIALSNTNVFRKLSAKEKKYLLDLLENFSLPDATFIKNIEQVTRHDVKALEKFIREKIEKTSLKDTLEFIHFGLTSEDINNISYRLIIQRSIKEIQIPLLISIINSLVEKIEQNKKTVMIARTHGQKAIPTTLGKELSVFGIRLAKEISVLKTIKLTGKLNGAVGNFNALYFTYPNIDWINFSDKFIKSLNLEPNLTTTQINTYEDLIQAFQIFQRINSIFIDLSEDLWRYISDDWFILINKRQEVGSSTMPQKINPIDFENSEGNFGIANSLFEFFARKLPISRLQRDLSDSTVIRNIGIAFGYSLLGYKSLLQGLSRILPNKKQIDDDLHSDFAILAEGAQTFLRSVGANDPYSAVKEKTRGKRIGEEKWQGIINSLDIETEQKKRLTKLTPSTYIGLAEKITEKSLAQINKLT